MRRVLAPTSILPLVVFRVGFGLLMFASTLRFILKGWVQEIYLDPSFHFTYYGFSWVRPLPGAWMQAVCWLVAALSLCIALGFCYRASIIAFFVLFTYTELIDKAYYLNHYYFISVMSFLMIFLPLHRRLSLDTWLHPTWHLDEVPAWTVWAVRLQMGLVYFFAGLAKLQPDWLLHAMPLKIWLSANASFPLVGRYFDYSGVAFLMSWGGAFYDLTIPFWLLYRKTRPFAYIAVIFFHVMTAKLFQIGMFPWIMMACSLIFITASDYQAIYRGWQKMVQRFPLKNIDLRPWFFDPQATPELPVMQTQPYAPFSLSVSPFYHRQPAPLQTAPTAAHSTATSENNSRQNTVAYRFPKPLALLLIIYFAFQILFPLRHWLYSGDFLWTEQGFRFAWQVMIAEKTGHATFIVRDPATRRQWEVFPAAYLTRHQEKQMSFQPDMILEFAHYLESRFRDDGYPDVEVRAEVYVSINGQLSRLLIDPTVDLTQQQNTWRPKSWILP